MRSQTMELLLSLVILSIPGGFLKATYVKLYFALANESYMHPFWDYEE